MSNIILDGIMSLAVADALGVLIEFVDRNSLMQNPVKEMRSYGTYNQPAGTWSDDTTMTFSLMDSLMDGLNYRDVMDKFMNWFNHGDYTPHGELFDIGTQQEHL